MPKLKKYRLINLHKDTKILISSRLPGGRMHIDHLTDDQAKLLFESGSRYVEEVKKPIKRSNQKEAAE